MGVMKVLANLYLIWVNSIEFRLIVFGCIAFWIILDIVYFAIMSKDVREFNQRNGQRVLLSQLTKTRRQKGQREARGKRNYNNSKDLEGPLNDTLDILDGASSALSEILRRISLKRLRISYILTA